MLVNSNCPAVVVGETAIVQAMIENGRKTRRYSGLRARLAGEV